MEKEIGCRVIIQEVLDIQFDYVYIKVFISKDDPNISLLLVSHIILFKKGEYIVINLLSFA